MTSSISIEAPSVTRAELDAFLRAAVDTMPPASRRIAAYHLGWVDQDGVPVAANTGKAIRPTLALLAAEAVGGSSHDALPAAAAVELVHNFSLVHDDVIDRDLTRRHRPTTWTVFGLGPAVLAGDGLLGLAFAVLAASGHAAAQWAGETVSEAVMGMVEGQCVDLSFEGRNDVRLAECFAMAERKTALLISCACAVGATFGGGRPADVEHLRRFGLHLGFAFQLVDDLLGIWGNPAVTGKSARSDLQSRKKSFPVVAALVSRHRAGRELAELFACDRSLSDADVAHAAVLVERAGGRAWAERQRDLFVARALDDLDRARPADRAGRELRSMVSALTSRDH
jgi:geranylgeranyl diphosphate synthase type I